MYGGYEHWVEAPIAGALIIKKKTPGPMTSHSEVKMVTQIFRSALGANKFII